MTPEQKQLIWEKVSDWLSEENNPYSYVGNNEDLKNVVLDGRFNIESLVELVIKETERITEERIGKEIVICSAIRMNDGYIVRGHRHADVIRTASQIPRYKNDRPFGSNQGFVTSKGRYVDRIEGAKIQKLAGIKSKMPEGQEYLHGELYSEDLY